jgi:sterol desaturase/sphingolipid hydroxylase (fatty acid hydroxylase superfamily)
VTTNTRGIVMFGLILGYLYSNLLEWGLHKYILHGKLFRSFYSESHARHHRTTVKNDYIDTDFSKSEVAGLVGVALFHAPLLFIVPSFYLGAILGGIFYYLVHRYSHVYPGLGEKLFPWHYSHHMEYPDSNWGVTSPIWDILLGTYKHHDSSSGKGRVRLHSPSN